MAKKIKDTPKPYASAVRRGVAVCCGGTRNLLVSVINGNLNHIIKELSEFSVGSYEEDVLATSARQHLINAAKDLQRLERRLNQ